GAGAPEVLVDLRHGPTGAELVGEPFGCVPRNRLAIAGCLDVDGDEVAIGGGTIDDHQVGVLITHALDRLVDVGVGRFERRDLDPQVLVSGHVDGGPHLDDGVEGDRPGLGPVGDLDLGGGDHVDFVLG